MNKFKLLLKKVFNIMKYFNIFSNNYSKNIQKVYTENILNWLETDKQNIHKDFSNAIKQIENNKF